MSDELKPCPFCGSAAKIEREGIRAHRTDAWTHIRCSTRCSVAPHVGESWDTFYYDSELHKNVRFCSDSEADQKSYERALRSWNTRAQSSDGALTCCTPSAEEKALLAAGDYTAEELWGGSRPTCPKCIDGALTNEGAEPVAYINPAHLETMGKTATGSASCVIFNSSQGGCLKPLYSDPPTPASVAFQLRVRPWMTACFGETIAGDRQERNHRFLEEALELVQACGATADEAHQLVDYVYGRPAGEPAQEVGGVMVTMAALCLAQGMDMHKAAEAELSRIWTKVEQIRAKQAAKPAIGPLPGAYPNRRP